MSERGFFVVDRGVFDHPIFAPEPFTEREAWIWMLSAAAWADKRIRVGRAFIELKRGQLAFALRFIAVKFKWTDSRVRRFLKRLESDAMVTLSATREATHVTICNYDEYQLSGRADDAPTDAQPDVRSTHPRRKEEELKKDNNKEVSKKETREGALSFCDPPDFEEFWACWPNKVGRRAALKAYGSATKRGARPSEIVDGIQRYIRDKPPDRPWLNPATFLNQNRWEDQPAKVEHAKTGNIIAASDKLISLIDSFDAGPSEDYELRGGAGSPAVRRISQGAGN